MKNPKTVFLFLIIFYSIFTISTCKNDDPPKASNHECLFQSLSDSDSQKETFDKIDNTLQILIESSFFKKFSVRLIDSLHLVKRSRSYNRTQNSYPIGFAAEHNLEVLKICNCLSYATLNGVWQPACDGLVRNYLDVIESPIKITPRVINYINNKKFKNKKTEDEIAILILNKDNSKNKQITQLIVDKYKSNGYRTSSNLFHLSNLIKKKEFQRLMDGTAPPNKYYKHVDHILLGVIDTQKITSHKLIKNWTTYSTTLNLQLINTLTGEAKYESKSIDTADLNPNATIQLAYEPLISDFIIDNFLFN